MNIVQKISSSRIIHIGMSLVIFAWLGGLARPDTVLAQAGTIQTDKDDASKPHLGGGDPAGRYALLVGIDDYPGVRNDLPSSVADASLMRDVLIDTFGFDPDNIVLLTDEAATRDQILSAFLHHLGQAGPDGVAVFYYSGHGLHLDGNHGVSDPLDPEPDGADEAIYVWGEAENSSVILDDELGYLAGLMKTDRMLMVLDACFSGTGTRGDVPSKEVRVKDVVANLEMPALFMGQDAAIKTETDTPTGTGAISELLLQPQRHVLLSASADNEVALAGAGDLPTRASVFTYYLLQVLDELPPDATFAELMEQVRPRVTNYALRKTGTPQTPQIEGRAGDQAIHTLLGRR